jgi:hypothetical protein
MDSMTEVDFGRRVILRGYSRRLGGEPGEVTLAQVSRNGLHELYHHLGDLRQVLALVESGSGASS